jgi:hypothetical protein
MDIVFFYKVIYMHKIQNCIKICKTVALFIETLLIPKRIDMLSFSRMASLLNTFHVSNTAYVAFQMFIIELYVKAVEEIEPFQK